MFADNPKKTISARLNSLTIISPSRKTMSELEFNNFDSQATAHNKRMKQRAMTIWVNYIHLHNPNIDLMLYVAPVRDDLDHHLAQHW